MLEIGSFFFHLFLTFSFFLHAYRVYIIKKEKEKQTKHILALQNEKNNQIHKKKESRIIYIEVYE